MVENCAKELSMKLMRSSVEYVGGIGLLIVDSGTSFQDWLGSDMSNDRRGRGRNNDGIENGWGQEQTVMARWGDNE